jgi:hypothetical protein
VKLKVILMSLVMMVSGSALAAECYLEVRMGTSYDKPYWYETVFSIRSEGFETHIYTFQLRRDQRSDALPYAKEYLAAGSCDRIRILKLQTF